MNSKLLPVVLLTLPRIRVFVPEFTAPEPADALSRAEDEGLIAGEDLVCVDGCEVR